MTDEPVRRGTLAEARMPRWLVMAIAIKLAIAVVITGVVLWWANA